MLRSGIRCRFGPGKGEGAGTHREERFKLHPPNAKALAISGRDEQSCGIRSNQKSGPTGSSGNGIPSQHSKVLLKPVNIDGTYYYTLSHMY